MYSLNFIFLMFPMIFQSLMGLRKSRCDVLNGTIQRWACLISTIKKNPQWITVHGGDSIILDLECTNLGRPLPFSFQTTCKKK
jgi:hypothetical protein